jgi:hypothetical protein
MSFMSMIRSYLLCILLLLHVKLDGLFHEGEWVLDGPAPSYTAPQVLESQAEIGWRIAGPAPTYTASKVLASNAEIVRILAGPATALNASSTADWEVDAPGRRGASTPLLKLRGESQGLRPRMQ